MSKLDRDGGFVEAFPSLYLRAYQAAFRVCGDRDRAQEFAQEAMTRAYIHWDRLDDRRGGWVVTVSANLAIDSWRRERRAGGPNHRRTADDCIEPTVAQRLDIASLLAALPRRQRQVAVLRFMEDWSERDVARALGCSVGSVKRHTARASASLRRALEPAATTTRVEEAS
jgi:RNA polymerase sigma factor (sigma-70 family)